MTLSEVIIYINKALNYPSVSITDIDLYFNQAFSEINTQLHIAIPSLEEMRISAIEAVSEYDNMIKGNTEPSSSETFPIFEGRGEQYISPGELAPDPYYSVSPNNATLIRDGGAIPWTPDVPSEEDETPLVTDKYYYNPEPLEYKGEKHFFYKGNWFDKLYYIFFDNLRKKYRIYESVVIDNGYNAAWYEIYENPTDINLEDYLPKDWIFLFIIPYVCFKQAVRDGDQGVLFNNEMSVGFNQLRDCYHVPERVPLFKVAHLPAYTQLIKHRENVNFKELVPTRAIYDAYKIPKAIDAVYMDFYDKGGWGL